MVTAGAHDPEFCADFAPDEVEECVRGRERAVQSRIGDNRGAVGLRRRPVGADAIAAGGNRGLLRAIACALGKMMG